jgi:hypothetical protein
MRWVFFLILTWVLLIVQTTVGGFITLDTSAIGPIGPDLLAPLGVFVALYARQGIDAVLAASLLGFALDLGTGGGPGSGAVVGVMPIAYALAAWGLFSFRDAFFRGHVLTRALLTFLFCLVVHFAWVTLQSLLGWNWSGYWAILAQVVGLAIYTGVLAPGAMFLLDRARRWLIRPSMGRSRQRR